MLEIRQLEIQETSENEVVFNVLFCRKEMLADRPGKHGQYGDLDQVIHFLKLLPPPQHFYSFFLLAGTVPMSNPTSN